MYLYVASKIYNLKFIIKLQSVEALKRLLHVRRQVFGTRPWTSQSNKHRHKQPHGRTETILRGQVTVYLFSDVGPENSKGYGL